MEQRTGNLVLDALSEASLTPILERSREVELRRAETVWDVGKRIGMVYFPVDAVVSLVTVMRDGASVEAAMLERDGVTGIPAALGRRRFGMTRAVVQIPGRAHAIRGDDFEAILADDSKTAELVRGLALALMTEISQSVACNRLHSADERLARWLARAHDGARRDEFPLTHEFLAQMLGVRRATVTVAAQTLKDEELIAYRRGWVSILDGAALRDRACECYSVISGEYRELLSPS